MQPTKYRRIIPLWEVKHRTSRSRSSVYRDMAQGKFPKQVRVGKRAVGWFEDEIEAWLEACARGEI